MLQYNLKPTFYFLPKVFNISIKLIHLAVSDVIILEQKRNTVVLKAWRRKGRNKERKRTFG